MIAAPDSNSGRRSVRCVRALVLAGLLLCMAAQAGEKPQPKRVPPKTGAHTPTPTPDPTPPANPQAQEAEIAEQQKQQQYAAMLAMQQSEDARKKKAKERPTIKWQYSVEDALTKAATDEKPFAVYFCSEEAARLAGEGQDALEKYRAQNDDLPAPTIFDTPVVPAALKKAGIAYFVKVPNTTENKALFKLYDAKLNTIVLLAPTGDVLIDFSGTDCTSDTVAKYLNEEFRPQYEEWWGARQRQLNLQK